MTDRSAVETVTVGFDGTPASRAALLWAADEAALRGWRLRVLHVDWLREAALRMPAFAEEAAIDERLLEEGVRLAKRAHPGVEVSGELLDPPAGAALVHASAGAALVVVGSRGLGALQRLELGSVSRYCVEHLECPVLVVRTGHASG